MTGTRRGRPPAASRHTIEDAASELFLEQGYAATSVDDVARRAGVSRSSFFNYFDAKSDLLWVAVDDALAQVPDALDRAAADAGPDGSAFARAVDAVRAAALDVACRYPAAGIPWAITQAELMGTGEEAVATGLVRQRRQELRVAAFVSALDPAGDALLHRAFAAALVGAAAAAAAEWIAAGVERGPLAALVERAIDPVCRGYATASAA